MEKPKPKPDVLELRVHGVGNTPPQGMLGVDADKVSRTQGDDLASFWETKDQHAAEERGELSDSDGTPRRHIEAYSWGSLARAGSLPGLGLVAGFGQAVIRAGWTFLIPLGIANAAYWARKLPEDVHVGPGPDPSPGKAPAPYGAAAVRLFCLLLSLLIVATFTVASVDVVGTQCFGERVPATDPKHPTDPHTVSRSVCSHLPSVVRSMAGSSDGVRIATFALVPVSVLLLLMVIAWSGRVRFDQRVSLTRAVRGGTSAVPRWRGVPVMARTGFWRTATNSGKDASLHAAAGFALVTGILVYQRVQGDPLSDGLALAWTLGGIAAAVLLVGVALRVAAKSSGAPDVDDGPGRAPVAGGESPLNAKVDTAASVRARAWVVVSSVVRRSVLPHGLLLWGSVVLLGAVLIGVGLSGNYLAHPGSPSLAPVSLASDAIVTMIVGLLVLLCVVGIGLRRAVGGVVWMALVSVIVVAGVAAAIFRLNRQNWPAGIFAGVAIGAAAILVFTVLTVDKDASDRRNSGWAGKAPAVFMTLAAGLALVLSSLVGVGLPALLDAPAKSDCTTQCSAPSTPPAAIATPRGDEVSLIGTHHVLVVPTIFTAFGWATLAVLAGLVVIAIAVVWRGMTAGDIPVRPRGTYLGVGLLSEAGADIVLSARRAAAMAQRAEIVVGALAALLGGALVFAFGTSLVVAATKPSSSNVLSCRAACENNSLRAVVAGLLLAVLAGVASNVVGGTHKAANRPWGFLWDLQCFLPRAAHPFGPPCYSERVVPELRRRIDDWLESERADDKPRRAREQDENKRVVISAHSMGVVLAISTLFARWDGAQTDEDGNVTWPWADSRISLLTYGTQLRPYFGRFFPELLGPRVIGNRPSLRPRMWSPDPWSMDPDAKSSPSDETAGDQYTLLESLGGRSKPRWISLWRRTDFAGFPIDAYTIGPPRLGEEGPDADKESIPGRSPTVPIDRMADEYDEQTYMFVAARHSGYPQSAAYERAIRDLTRGD
ncbi:hypothetical protein [Cellulomonas sp. P5_C6]